MSKLRFSLLVMAGVWVILGLAACGGSKKESATPVPVDNVPARTFVAATYPPTWTPKPTLTPAPRVTIEYTYVPPTEHTLLITRTPTATASAAQANGPVLLITADMVNPRMATQLQSDIGVFFGSAPTVSFQDGTIRISAEVLTVPGQPSTARNVIIDATLESLGTEVEIAQQNAVFADDNTPYDDVQLGIVLPTLNNTLNDLITELYTLNSPSDARFTIVGLTINNIGITIQTQTSGTPG